MPLDEFDGAKALQIITSRYHRRDWRKRIEKTLSLPPSGLNDDVQRKIFVYLKVNLQAYKSRRADPPAWIVGGLATREVIDRAKFNPQVVDPSLTADQMVFLGTDPGEDVDGGWWEEMLVKWFEEPEEDGQELVDEDPQHAGDQPEDSQDHPEGTEDVHPASKS